MKFLLNKPVLVKLFMGCLWVPFFVGCTSPQKEDPPINNPNTDSELTLLMRKMFDDADSIKQSIRANSGTITDEFIADLELVHTATPSKESLRNPTFKAFNDLMIQEAKSIQTDSVNQKKGFNNLVNRCIDCHKTFCPGPITRIKKLKI